MKRTSFGIMSGIDDAKSVSKYLSSYSEDEVEIVEETADMYVVFDDRNVKIRELEECFMRDA